MLTVIWPVLFILVGLLMWAFLPGKAATAGFVIFCCGMGALALVMAYADPFHLGGSPRHKG